MKKKRRARFCLLLTAMLLALSACQSVREKMPEKNSVRIYDVLPQDRDKAAGAEILEQTQAKAAKTHGEERDRLLETAQQLEALPFEKHEFRVNVFTSVAGAWDKKEAPYAGQIAVIEEASGIEIEYIILNSWEELREELRKSQGDGVTKLVIFDNSYDKSLLKEASSGGYADLERELEEEGFYEEELYEQTVLNAGRIDGRQVLIPMLYTVSGMVRGEILRQDLQTGELIEPDEIETEPISFPMFLSMMTGAMQKERTERAEIPFLSAGFLEEAGPDLFLCAAGADWGDYRNQETLFEMLYEYLQTYRKTQREPRKDAISMQELWAYYLNEMRYSKMEPSELPRKVIEDLQLDIKGMAMNMHIAKELLERTDYFVDCAGAEEIAYHSVIGLLACRNYYEAGLYTSSPESIADTLVASGKMGYWPIGTMQSPDEYAAQPINYAAVVEGGDEKLAVQVIRAMTQQLVLPEFGFSIRKEVQREQLRVWSERAERYEIRAYEFPFNGKEYKEGSTAGYWASYMSGSEQLDHKTKYAEQIQQQLDHVVFAQIADREILKIWRDTLTEAAESGLTVQAGYALLCERMNEWWK